MPVAKLRGANLNNEVLGSHGPWVALSPGGRRALDMVKSLAQRMADAGYGVLIHDRRNCGSSDIVIGGKRQNTRSGPTTSTSCSRSSTDFLPCSAVARPAAGFHSCSR